MPPVALFAATALAFALTAGFGLGFWLLLERTFPLPLAGTSWPALVQVHGLVQLFGFAGLFIMGVGMHLLPRLRGAELPSPRRQYAVYALTVSGLLLRAIAQPVGALPGREALLALAGALLVAGALLFAATVLTTLVRGRNRHRADELVIGVALVILPIAAILAAIGPIDGWPLVVPQDAADRATWTMLLGCVVTMVVGVWARLAPGFVAARPARTAGLVAGVALWLAGTAAIALDLAVAPALLVLGSAAIVIALNVFGPTIARQRLEGHARLTQFALRSAFAWALAGAALVLLGQLGLLPATSFVVDSAARHALGLGFVTLAVYGVAARALPSFLGRRLWSPRAHLFALVATNIAVILRVVPEALALGGPLVDLGLVLSGALAYAALVAFAVNIALTLRRGERAEGPVGLQPIVFRGPVPE